MSTASLITCLWPGLPQLWWRGQWQALGTALVFGIAVNLALMSTFIWPEMLPGHLKVIGWIAIVGVWGFFVWRGAAVLPNLAGNSVDDKNQGLFVSAQAEYLKNHWLEAESLLEQVLRRDPRDVEAHLMRATLLRRTARDREAELALSDLERMSGAERWRLEIARERRLLAATTPADHGATLEENRQTRPTQ
jgi:hypothetical protein